MNRVNIKINEMEYYMEEELKTLRTNLLFCGVDKKVLLVTSTVPGEGKSETSMNLAVSLANLNKKVLLMDMDLRKSVMIPRYAIEQVKHGMAHFLSGQCQLSEVICATNIPRMHLAVAGPVTPNPTELLSGEIFPKMLATLREVYDYIIIDSAPLGLVIDSAIIARECDGALLVVESGRAKYRQVQSVKAKIEASGCKVLGVVLNKIKEHNMGYYNAVYRKYGRYGNYSEDVTDNKEKPKA